MVYCLRCFLQGGSPHLLWCLFSPENFFWARIILVSVDQNGKLIQEGRVCWSEAPAVVVIQKPYAISLLPRHVEIVQLTASGNFEEALALCKLLPPEESSPRSAKDQSIHIRYAPFLFENGSYEEAMEHFVASQVEITYVLALYPSIIIPKSSCIPEPQKFADVEHAPYLSLGYSGPDDLDSTPSNVLESDEMDIESKKMSHNTLMALIKYLQKKRYSVIEKATAEGTEEVVSDAVGDFLWNCPVQTTNQGILLQYRTLHFFKLCF